MQTDSIIARQTEQCPLFYANQIFLDNYCLWNSFKIAWHSSYEETKRK